MPIGFSLFFSHAHAHRKIVFVPSYFPVENMFITMRARRPWDAGNTARGRCTRQIGAVTCETRGVAPSRRRRRYSESRFRQQLPRSTNANSDLLIVTLVPTRVHHTTRYTVRGRNGCRISRWRSDRDVCTNASGFPRSRLPNPLQRRHDASPLSFPVLRRHVRFRSPPSTCWYITIRKEAHPPRMRFILGLK